MRRHQQAAIAAPPDTPGAQTGPVVTINRRRAVDLLKRLEPESTPLQLPAAYGPPPDIPDAPSPEESPEERWNRAIGCKTSEVALTLLAQLVSLEHPTGTAADPQMESTVAKAMATLAELEPTTATEALLATQMVGAQRAAMTFLARSLAQGQQVEMVDRNVTRATKFMGLFNEQIEAMAKLKGKGGQQRVVVEHVTVAAGGQAIVGNVTPRGGGSSGDDEQ